MADACENAYKNRAFRLLRPAMYAQKDPVLPHSGFEHAPPKKCLGLWQGA